MTVPPGMIGVAEAHARLTALFSPCPAEEIALADAGGRVLARDVVAGRDQPPFDASAMDGYALRAREAAPGARFRVVGTSQAGAGYEDAVGSGQCVRIYTGAPLPAGADMVLIQEDAERDGDTIRVRADRDDGGNVRPAGSDFRRGARLTAPRRLSPGDVALAAAMNAPRVWVTRKPIVAIAPTGDELVSPGGEPGRDQIVASNNYGLKAMLEAAGAEVRMLPIARDSPESLTAVLGLAEGADLIVTLGGASVGDFDLVQSTAMSHGLELDFYKVAIRPGKPLMAGRLGPQVLIGLPGNPVSALVCGLVFVKPAVERMLGLPGGLPPTHPATLAAPVPANGPRTHYMRARVEAGEDGWLCTAFESQDSSLLSILSKANALLVRAPGAPAAPEGNKVEFVWL